MARDRLHALSLVLQLTTLELKLDAFIYALERRYRPDQPRAPRGTPIGGQWILYRAHVAGRRCDGFSAGCQNGGTFGSSGSVKIGNKRMCRDCALRYLGIEELPRDDQLKTIKDFDPSYRD